MRRAFKLMISISLAASLSGCANMPKMPFTQYPSEEASKKTSEETPKKETSKPKSKMAKTLSLKKPLKKMSKVSSDLMTAAKAQLKQMRTDGGYVFDTLNPNAPIERWLALSAFKRIDSDDNRYIDFEEFVIETDKSPKYRFSAAKADLTIARFTARDFYLADRNRDGYLDAQEFKWARAGIRDLTY